MIINVLGKVTIQGTATLENNTATNGGAIANNIIGTVEITGGTLQGNTATENGGAIYNYNSSTAIITGGTLEDNSAANGGAIYNKSTLTLETVTLEYGGEGTATEAIYNDAGSVTVSGRLEISGYGKDANAIVNNNGTGGTGSFELADGATLTMPSGSSFHELSGTSSQSPLTIADTSTIGNAPLTLSVSEARKDLPLFEFNAAQTEAALKDFTLTQDLLEGGWTLALSNDGRQILLQLLTDVYVDGKAGSDVKNSGTTPDAPVKTLERAYELLKNGGTIHIVDTVSVNEDVTLTSTACTVGDVTTTAGEAVTIQRYVKPEGSGYTTETFTGQMFAVNADATLTLEGITVDGGSVASGTGPIVQVDARATLEVKSGATLQNNQATGNGGAIYSAGTVEIAGGTLKENSAANGGAIYSVGTVTMTVGTLTGNSATEDGGAIYNYNSGTVEITGVTLENNSAANGGAITNAGTLTLETVTLQYGGEGTATEAIYNAAGSVTVSGTLEISGYGKDANAIVNNNGTGGTGSFKLANDATLTMPSGSSFHELSGTSSQSPLTIAGAYIFTTEPLTLSMSAPRKDLPLVEFNAEQTEAALKDFTLTQDLLEDGWKLVLSPDAKQILLGKVPTEVYVDGQSGNDVKNTGTTPDDPIQTLERAYALLQRGGTIHIVDTVSVNESVTLTQMKYEVEGGSQITAGGAVTIQRYVKPEGSGYTTETFTGQMFEMTDDTTATLVFEDITVDGMGVAVEGSIIKVTGSATLAIKNGATLQNNKTTGDGGAIYNAGTVEITGGTLQNNTATDGGAIYSSVSTSKVTITGGTLQNNTATDGGAIYFTGKVTLGEGATLQNNKATQNGGAIYSSASTNTVEIKGGTLSGNTATVNGGAIYNNGTVEITGGTLSGNEATGNGGAIYSAGTSAASSTVTISGGTLSGNSATWGGAIYSAGTSAAYTNRVEITGGKLENNSASSGGAICNSRYSTATITDGTLENNEATGKYGYGGAIYNYDTVTISGGTLSGNKATNGGAIYNNGTATISGGTLENNEAAQDGGAVYCYTARSRSRAAS